MPDPPSRRGAEMKRRILHAAGDLMHQRGVAATTIDDVLDASGTGKSQFYHYFSSKNELLREVVRYQLKRYLNLQRPLLDNLSTWDAIKAWLDTLADQHEERELIGGCPIGSLAVEMVDRDEELRIEFVQAFTEWESFLAQGLAKMKKRGLMVPAADPEVLAEIAMTAIQGGYLLSTTKKDIRPMQNALDAAYLHLRSFATETMGDPDSDS